MSIAVFIAIALALILYPMVILGDLLANGSGDGQAEGLTISLTGFLCFMLFLSLMLSAIQRKIPLWSFLVAIPLLALTCGPAVEITQLLRLNNPARWLSVVPALAPGLILAYLAWAQFPRLHVLIPVHLASAIVWIGVICVVAIPIPRPKAGAEKKIFPLTPRRAEFNRVWPNSKVDKWLPFLEFPELREETLQTIRGLDHRQAGVEGMLNQGDYRAFNSIPKFDLSPRPELCDCAKKWLKAQSAALAPTPEREFYRDLPPVNQSSETLVWFAQNKCPMLAEVNGFEAALLLYPDAREQDKVMFDAFDEIQRILSGKP